MEKYKKPDIDGGEYSNKDIHDTVARSDGLERETVVCIMHAIKKISGDNYSYTLEKKAFDELHNHELKWMPTNERIDYNWRTVGVARLMEHLGKSYKVDGGIAALSFGNNDDVALKERFRTELTEGFQSSRSGRLPKIIDDLAVAGYVCGFAPEEMAARFDVKTVSAMKNAGVPIRELPVFYMHFSKSECLDLIDHPYRDVIADIIIKECNSIKPNLEKADWILKHPNTHYSIIKDICDYAQYIQIERDTNIEAVKAKISKAKSIGEVDRIENEYRNVGFKFDECKFELKFCDASYGKYDMSILRPGDTRMVSLGYDTSCCQHLGGAGESAMMFGLCHPHAGFWALTDYDTGKVLAQAEVWEASPDHLVFDNIEFADDKDISKYRAAISEWCRKSDYGYISVGARYNKMDFDGMPRLTIPEMPNLPCNTKEDYETLYMVNGNDLHFGFDHHFPLFREEDGLIIEKEDFYSYAKEMMERNIINEYELATDVVYSDAMDKCYWLKNEKADFVIEPESGEHKSIALTMEDGSIYNLYTDYGILSSDMIYDWLVDSDCSPFDVTEIAIPEGITNIFSGAFAPPDFGARGYRGTLYDEAGIVNQSFCYLNKVNIPNTVKHIGSEAFDDCDELLKSNQCGTSRELSDKFMSDITELKPTYEFKQPQSAYQRQLKKNLNRMFEKSLQDVEIGGR